MGSVLNVQTTIVAPGTTETEAVGYAIAGKRDNSRAIINNIVDRRTSGCPVVDSPTTGQAIFGILEQSVAGVFVCIAIVVVAVASISIYRCINDNDAGVGVSGTLVIGYSQGH